MTDIRIDLTPNNKETLIKNYDGWRRKNPALSGKHWSLFYASPEIHFEEGCQLNIYCIFCKKALNYTRHRKGDPVDNSLRDHWVDHENASPGLREFAMDNLRTPYQTRKTAVVEVFGPLLYRPSASSSGSSNSQAPPRDPFQAPPRVPSQPPPPPRVPNPLPLGAFPMDFPFGALDHLNPSLWDPNAQPNFKTAQWNGMEVFVASGCKDSVGLGKPQLAMSFFYEQIRLTSIVLVDGNGVVCPTEASIREKFVLLETYKLIAIRLCRLPNIRTSHKKLSTVLASLNSIKLKKTKTKKPLHYLVEAIADVSKVAPLFLDNLYLQWSRISESSEFDAALSPSLLKHRDLAPLDTLIRRISSSWTDSSVAFLRNTIYYRSGQSKVKLNSVAMTLGFSDKQHLRSVLGDGCWFSLAKHWLSDFRDTHTPCFRLGVAALLCYNRRKALSRKDALEVLRPLTRGEVKIYVPCLPSILAIFVTMSNPEIGPKLETVEDVELEILGDMKRRMADEWTTVKDENLERRVTKWVGMIFDEKTSRFSHERRRDASPRRQ